MDKLLSDPGAIATIIAVFLTAILTYIVTILAQILMPYRLLCNEVQPEGTKPSPYQVSGLSCYVPFHNIRDLPTFFFSSFFFCAQQ
jgi:hypothetical protein